MQRVDFELQILHYDAFGLRSAVAVLFDSDDSDKDSSFLDTLGLKGPSSTEKLETGDTLYIKTSVLDLASVNKYLFKTKTLSLLIIDHRRC